MRTLTVTWHGCANIRLEWKGKAIFLDPWFRRNDKSDPRIESTMDSVDDDAIIFMSHGHFDHLQDVPSIIAKKPGVSVYCSKTARETIHDQMVARKELDATLIPSCMDRVHVIKADDVITIDGKDITVHVIKSRHAIYDVKTIAKAFFKAETWRRIRQLCHLMDEYPAGDVFGYDIHLGNEMRVIMYGSLWSRYRDILRQHANPDVCILPIAGRFNSDKIALKIAKILHPRIIIPVHHDDFYPPISYWTPVTAIKEGAGHLDPPAKFMELPVEEPVKIEIDTS